MPILADLLMDTDPNSPDYADQIAAIVDELEAALKDARKLQEQLETA